jgi:hypothetical protein
VAIIKDFLELRVMPETYSLNKITMKASTLHLIMALIMAMVFAGLVSFVDVILGIDFLQIEDRVNYLTLAENSSLWFTDILSQPLIYIIIDKPLFKVVFFLLNSIGLTPIGAIRAVIFFSTAVTFFVMLTRCKIPLVAFVFLLFFDWFIANYINSLRMGFATSLFLYASFYLKGRKQKYIFALTTLIHYGFIIVLGIIYFEYVLKKRKISVNKSILLTAALGFTFGLNVLVISSFLGFGELSERYGQFDGIFNVGFGALFFLGILIIFLFQSSAFKVENLLSMMLITFYLSSVLFFPPISRILISTIVLILASGFALRSYYRYLFIFLIVLYSAVFTLSGRYDGAVFFF